MSIVGSQKGAALITALMLTVLALVIAIALLTMINTGTKVSASQKRYRSSLTAAQGGVDLLTRELMPRLLSGESKTALENDYSLIDLHLSLNACLRQKLDQAREGWSSCSEPQSSGDPGQAPDITLRLSGEPTLKGFSVTAKIVDTIPGNSDRSGNELLDVGGSVAGKDEAIRPRHVPAMYNLSVQGVREEEGTREKAHLSVLYAF